MTFLQFLLYYISAKLIFEGLVVSLLLLRNRYITSKLKKAIESGKLKVVDLNEFSDEEKKTWN